MRRRYRAPRRTSIVLAILAALAVWRVWTQQRQPGAPEALPPGTYEVARVVDGDTLLLANRARVRLIGVDSPEAVRPDHPVESWGREATQFSQAFVRDARNRVRLELDRERKDRFDRFLAYVWADDRLLNEELIRAGLARARTEFSYSQAMKRRFRAAEAEARQNRRGIWSDAESRS
jgi:micrococcal nuclease